MDKDIIYNRPTTRLITINGQTKSVADWSREVGLNVNTLYTRICTRKWDYRRAILTPTRLKRTV